jgi:hypothetical protein
VHSSVFQNRNYSHYLMEFNTLLIGKKAALVILTDGEPSDGDIVQIMKPLYQLPVSGNTYIYIYVCIYIYAYIYFLYICTFICIDI